MKTFGQHLIDQPQVSKLDKHLDQLAETFPVLLAETFPTLELKTDYTDSHNSALTEDPNLTLESLLTEIDFSDKAAFQKYNSQHKMRPTTKVHIAGKQTTAKDADPDAFKDDEKDKEEPKSKLSKKETEVRNQKKEQATDPEVADHFNNVLDYLDKEEKAALDLNGKKRENRMSQLSSMRDSLNNLPDDIKNTASNTFAQGLVTEGRVNSGAGKNRLGYEQVQSLVNKKDYLLKAYGDGSAEHIKKFVRASRPHKVAEDYVRSSFDALPKKLQTSLQGKGKVGDAGKGKHFLGYIKEDGSVTSDRSDPGIKKGKDGKLEVKRGNPGSRDRGLLVWRAINEQGMQDPYTGLPLDLSSIDLEHTVAFTNKDNGDPTEEDYLNREHDDNIIITATNTNQKKSDMSMKDFMETHVDTQKDKSQEQFTKMSNAYEGVNKLGSSTEQTAKLLIEDGKLNSKVNSKTLGQAFEQDDQAYDSARKEFREVADSAKDKKKAATLKSEIGKDTLMAMGLGRGLTSPDGRRTLKLSSDNTYRGFLLSMANSPDKQEEFKKEWENARAVGNEDKNRTSGNGQKMMMRYLMDKKLISKEVLDDPKLGKVWSNALKEGILEFNEWNS